MSKTTRWWHKNKNRFLFEKKLGDLTPSWANINPFYFKHEYKLIRVKLVEISIHINTKPPAPEK